LPPTLAGRSIRIPMMRATRKVKRRIDESIAFAIRSKLLTYRFNHLLEKPGEGVNPIEVPDGRLVEIFTPLLLVAPSQKVESALSSLARELYEEIIEEDRTTEQAEVFFALLKCYEGGISEVEISEVVGKYNENLPKNEQISNSYCGRVLSTLGFKKKRMPKTGRTAVVLDAELIERLKHRYEVTEQKTLPQLGIKEALEHLKIWLGANRDADGLVDEPALSEEIKRLGFEPQKIIKILLDEHVIFEVNVVGKLGVGS
jgi:hypothetical protein